MPRKRVIDDLPKLGSWEEVNQALAVIGDNQRSIEAIEARMQEAIDEAKSQAEVSARIYIENNGKLERQIRAYAESHREDMEGKKTKILNFGSVGFRKSTKIILPKKGPKLEEVIRPLLHRGMADCVKQSDPTVDKNALGRYPTEDIVGVGVGITVDDIFWYEPDRDKLPQK